MSAEVMATVARLRRAMPRNADAMALCDFAEAKAIIPACQVCEERRAKNAVAMKAKRKKIDPKS